MQNLWRPKKHFSPLKGWMNDPVGLVYFKGKYHLFYEHNPYATHWDKMHWGHAVSKDLYNWEHLDVAIFPDEMGEIYSGSCYFDEKNVSGLGTKENPPLLFYYTSHQTETKREQQCIAYSTDFVTFTKYEGNPVIPGSNNTPARDPYVFANPILGGYAMCLTTEDEIRFYISDNLLEWKISGSFAYESNCAGSMGRSTPDGGENRTTRVVTTREPRDIYECPCLIPFDTNEGMKWVLLISMITTPSATYAREVRYFVGEFNGRSFKQTEFPNEMLLADYGPDFYAATVFANTKEKILLAWLGNSDYVHDIPTDREGYRGVLCMPRMLGLVKTAEGYRLKSELVPFPKEDVFIVSRDVKPGDVLRIRNSDGEVTITVTENAYIIDRTKAGDRSFSASFASQSVLQIPRVSDYSLGPKPANKTGRPGTSDLTVIIDGCVMEVFADDGLNVATLYIFPSSRSHSLV